MDILGFIIALTPITLSPGASFTLAMNNVASGGMYAVSRIIIGTALGIYTHSLLASIGLTGLLSLYPTLMHTITVIGTGYLLYLAFRLIESGLREKSTTSCNSGKVGIKEAYLANVLNIKAILLYVTIVPLFVSANGTSSVSLVSYLTLATLHIVMMSAWLLFSAQLLIRSSGRINPIALKKTINIGGGIVLIVLTLSPYISTYFH
ncbi:LysE family translocator [Pectobacterium parmentieri]|uniref:LysE family translocator n=1 Tax=Pectobacterium parmentieri TaxID=1905730 RepID=UPI000EB0A4B5|nr:LysE family translocator [Pectobacterium parmentieri]AYH01736.1 LysE family translocator [Pectobacterium parmentieri]AYH28003.1 LysE family translocator [Pectobacterium parmentieri]AYH32309.1 LysE family translocator [Pectobacterium parmentieri]MBI0516916.1 LysE family translocator [Pectobacterium parmentieri]